MKNVSVIIKPVSSYCDMSCKYCFYADEARNRSTGSYGFMKEEILEYIIKKIMENTEKSVYFLWQGGEPTIRGVDFYRKAVCFQQKYARKGVQIINSFQTNGYSIDDEWCKFFRQNQFLLGISVDGIKDTHDLYRRTVKNSASFDVIEKNIELLDRYGVDFNILTVITSPIVDQIEKIYAFYKEKKWNYQQYICCLEPLIAISDKSINYLKPGEYGLFLNKLFDLWYEDLKYGKQPYIRQFENYVGIAAGYFPESCEQRGVCGIQYMIEADGSVFPCDFYGLDKYKLGNLVHDSFETIDQKRSELRFLEESVIKNQSCRNCEYFNLCRGGCKRNRNMNEEPGNISNRLCEDYKMFFQQHYKDIMRIGYSIR